MGWASLRSAVRAGSAQLNRRPDTLGLRRPYALGPKPPRARLPPGHEHPPGAYVPDAPRGRGASGRFALDRPRSSLQNATNQDLSADRCDISIARMLTSPKAALVGGLCHVMRGWTPAAGRPGDEKLGVGVGWQGAGDGPRFARRPPDDAGAVNAPLAPRGRPSTRGPNAERAVAATRFRWASLPA